MTTENLAPKGPPLTKVRRGGNLLFVSGQLPRGQDGAIVLGDIVVQTRQSIANLQAALATAGATLEHVVKVTAWLTDVSYMDGRSEEHTSELQSLMRISYAVFCVKKKNTKR